MEYLPFSGMIEGVWLGDLERIVARRFRLCSKQTENIALTAG